MSRAGSYLVLAADTGDFAWITDPDTLSIYVDHRLDARRFCEAAADALLVLHVGPGAVPGARLLNRHLQLVPGGDGP